MKERLRELDFIRAFAALSVIMIHITANYIQVNRVAYYANQAVRYAVPVFIIISGMLLYESGYKDSGIRGYAAFMNRRLKKILIPYIVWSLIYIIYSMRHSLETITAQPVRFALDALDKLLWGTGYSHLYFIIIIIQLYFLYPLLRYCLARYKRLTFSASLLITLAFQTGVYLHLIGAIVLPSFVIPYYIFFPTWVFYFVFGMWFSTAKEGLKPVLQNRTIITGLIWLLSLAILILDSRYTKTYASSIKPSVMVYCTASFIFFYSLFQRFGSSGFILWRFMDFVSAQSFIIYLSHSLIISGIFILSGRMGMSRLWQGTAGMALLYGATVAASAAFAWVMGMTRAAGALGGAVLKGSVLSRANRRISRGL